MVQRQRWNSFWVAYYLMRIILVKLRLVFTATWDSIHYFTDRNFFSHRLAQNSVLTRSISLCHLVWLLYRRTRERVLLQEWSENCRETRKSSRYRKHNTSDTYNLHWLFRKSARPIKTTRPKSWKHSALLILRSKDKRDNLTQTHLIKMNGIVEVRGISLQCVA